MSNQVDPRRLPQPRLDEIAARAEAATTGPWQEGAIEETLLCRGYELGLDRMRFPWLGNTKLDAEFIAHARQDIPDLLAHLAALTESEQRLRDALEDALRLAKQATNGWACYANTGL